MINIAEHYQKLRNNIQLCDTEIIDLLQELKHFRSTAAFLAECHAASAEGLPKSASKYQKGRHKSICETAARLCAGDVNAMPYRPVDELAVAIERCQKFCDRVTEPSANGDF